MPIFLFLFHILIIILPSTQSTSGSTASTLAQRWEFARKCENNFVSKSEALTVLQIGRGHMYVYLLVIKQHYRSDGLCDGYVSVNHLLPQYEQVVLISKDHTTLRLVRSSTLWRWSSCQWSFFSLSIKSFNNIELISENITFTFLQTHNLTFLRTVPHHSCS